MRFLIDANLPRSAVGLLVGLGHFVDFARDIGLASACRQRFPDFLTSRSLALCRAEKQQNRLGQSYPKLRLSPEWVINTLAY